jgi:hypothetical protein
MAKLELQPDTPSYMMATSKNGYAYPTHSYLALSGIRCPLKSGFPSVSHAQPFLVFPLTMTELERLHQMLPKYPGKPKIFLSLRNNGKVICIKSAVNHS